MGRLPKRGERFKIGNLDVEILRADSRRLHSLLINLLEDESEPGEG